MAASTEVPSTALPSMAAGTDWHGTGALHLRACLMPRANKAAVAATIALSMWLGLPGCSRFKRKHIPVEHVDEVGYPQCDGKAPPAGEVVASGHLRSGPAHHDPTIVERFSIKKRGCLWSVEVRQEWPRATADVEVLYDAALKPLRIWKRLTLPGTADPAATADIRRYELRTQPVQIKRHNPDGRIDFEQLLGESPRVVIGPGRGLLSMWIRQAKLAVGQKVRAPAIDVRGLEKLEPVTLRREDDMQHPELGKVQVYSFYGSETVFTDAQGVVVGDLAGMRTDTAVKAPAPRAIPVYGPLDPINTP